VYWKLEAQKEMEVLSKWKNGLERALAEVENEMEELTSECEALSKSKNCLE